jgi:hypothetical protein
MDDFTVYDNFEEALTTLKGVLQQCQDMNLFLSNEKCYMMMTTTTGIKVNPAKIAIVRNLLVPQKQKDVCSFLSHAGYCRHFLNDFSEIAASLFVFLSKDVEFFGLQLVNKHLKL